MKKPVLKLMNNTHWKNEEIWENWRYWSIIIEEIYLKSARSMNYMNWKWKYFLFRENWEKTPCILMMIKSLSKIFYWPFWPSFYIWLQKMKIKKFNVLATSCNFRHEQKSSFYATTMTTWKYSLALIPLISIGCPSMVIWYYYAPMKEAS